MLKKLLLVTVCLILAGATYAAEPTAGKLECAPKTTSSGCILRWDFVRAPRGFYQVEYLDENSLDWHAMGRPYDSFQTHSQPVPAARLYRVRGCDDEMMVRSCVSSSVQWAISRPAADEIPEFLVDGNGVEMHILKNAPESVQVAQYNVYRLVQLLDRIPDISKLPPMTEPRAYGGTGAGRSDDYQILKGIYENYRERHRQATRID